MGFLPLGSLRLLPHTGSTKDMCRGSKILTWAIGQELSFLISQRVDSSLVNVFNFIDSKIFIRLALNFEWLCILFYDININSKSSISIWISHDWTRQSSSESNFLKISICMANVMMNNAVHCTHGQFLDSTPQFM